jgi:hypothetical protein
MEDKSMAVFFLVGSILILIYQALRPQHVKSSYERILRSTPKILPLPRPSAQFYFVLNVVLALAFMIYGLFVLLFG